MRLHYRYHHHYHRDDSSTHLYRTVFLIIVALPGAIQAFSSTHHVWKIPSSAHILSQDPLIYTIPNFLNVEECQDYIDYVTTLSSDPQGGRGLQRSNPPQVSLETSKLWPLPLLSLAAGIPSILKTVTIDASSSSSSLTAGASILQTALLPVSIAFGITITLVLLAQPILQAISNRTARTSVALALNQLQDISLIRPLVDRVSTMTGHAWEAWEAPVVTRYDPGAIFAKHGDASPTLGSEWEQEGGQRVITCICYLNDLGSHGGGGETYFDQLQIAVRPEPGKALVFFPADYDTKRADDRTTHESLPPSADQEKWIVQLFGRVGPRVPPPLGIPDEFNIR